MKRIWKCSTSSPESLTNRKNKSKLCSLRSSKKADVMLQDRIENFGKPFSGSEVDIQNLTYGSADFRVPITV